MPSMDPAALARRLREGDAVSVLDVRDRDEYRAWHVDGRHVTDAQIPHAKFLAANVRGDPTDLLPEELTEPLLVVCPQGKASGEVAEMLRESGVEAVNLAGGMNAWARVYESVDLAFENATVVQYQRPSSGCLAYLVVSGGEALAIDPLRTFADEYVDATDAAGADLRLALDTHVHADHVSGIRAVAARTDATPAIPAGARDRGLAFEARLVEDGEELAVGDATLEAIHAPGHTSELCAFRLDAGSGPDVLFTADALFLRSIGRPDLEAGDDRAREYADRAYDTLHDRLLALPDDTLIAPGHYADPADARGGNGETAEVDARGGEGKSAEVDVPDGAYVAPLVEVRELDVLALDRGAFVDRVVSRMPPQPANFERIVETNLGRAEMGDDEAFEAELGPNNCAIEAD